MRLKATTYPLLLLLLGVVLSGFYTPQMVPNVQQEDARRYVSDPEGRFSAEERSQMDAALSQLRQSYGIEAVLVVVPEVENDDPVSFTVELFELWGLGDKDRDNGLLILYMYDPAYRTIRFEVGYGLEGLLPDALTYQLTMDILVPGIKEGREVEAFLELFNTLGGILDGTEEGKVEPYLMDEGDAEFWSFLWGYGVLSLGVGLVYGLLILGLLRRQKRPAQALAVINNNQLFSTVFYLLVLVFPAYLIAGPIRGLLKRRFRKKVYDCPQCGTKGSITIHPRAPLIELTTQQAVEQRVGAKKFEYLDCSVCTYAEVLPQLIANSGYTKCPNCGGRTFHLDQERSISRSRAVRIYKCEYCGHTRKDHISHGGGGGPIIMGGGGFGGGGGFSGGGFGGGSSGGGGSTVRF